MYPGQYTLIGTELSFFTRKLEAQLRFQRIPWRYQFKTEARREELETKAGTHFIPLLSTPDRWLLQDTISIGPFLHERFSETPVIPKTPLQRSLCFILEDALNHWLGRVCVHSRWCYPDNVAWVGPRFGANIMLDRSIDTPFTDDELGQLGSIGPAMNAGFGQNACAVNGVGAEQAAAVQADFRELLDVLSRHFAQHPFLLGDRPCLADFALAGASKAHFITDPEPKSWLGQYEAMLTQYTESFFTDDAIEAGAWCDDDKLPDTVASIVNYFARTYFVSSSANIAAGLAGEKFYEYDIGYGVTRARTARRLNQARLHVKGELNLVNAAQDPSVRTLFEQTGILSYYLQ